MNLEDFWPTCGLPVLFYVIYYFDRDEYDSGPTSFVTVSDRNDERNTGRDYNLSTNPFEDSRPSTT